MVLRLEHKFNSIWKRIYGEYAQGFLVALQDLAINKDEISKFNLKMAVSKYLRINKDWFPLLYGYIDNNFNKKNGMFDFGIFKIPIPDEKDRGSFLLEFIDLVYPHIYPKNKYSKKFLQFEGHYEQFGVKVHSGDIVIDAGASIGLFSAYAASKGAQVYSFEPIQTSLNYLYNTSMANKSLLGRIEVIPLALHENKCTLHFSIDETNIGSASAVMNRQDKTFDVEAISLDEWVFENKIPRIDFIKADVEGAERNLLRGAAGVLKKYKPKLAICTYHLKDDPEILKDIILTANPGYKINNSSHKLFAR